ncbi:MAG: nuclear transport factor 2 family protein [Methanobacteriota archaeon]
MEPSAELREIIVGWFTAAAAGDVSWRDRHVSHAPELRIVGTDPNEWLKGEPAYAFLKTEAETIGGRIKLRVLEAEAYVEGNVGWGLARPEITLGDGTNVTPRWNAVFRKDEGLEDDPAPRLARGRQRGGLRQDFRPLSDR